MIYWNKYFINQMILLFLCIDGKARDLALKKVILWKSGFFSFSIFKFLLMLVSWLYYFSGSCVWILYFERADSFLGDIWNSFIFLEEERVYEIVSSWLSGNISRIFVRWIPDFAVKFLFSNNIFYLIGSFLLSKFLFIFIGLC